jgi:hypothetical protein
VFGSLPDACIPSSNHHSQSRAIAASAAQGISAHIRPSGTRALQGFESGDLIDFYNVGKGINTTIGRGATSGLFFAAQGIENLYGSTPVSKLSKQGKRPNIYQDRFPQDPTQQSTVKNLSDTPQPKKVFFLKSSPWHRSSFAQ